MRVQSLPGKIKRRLRDYYLERVGPSVRAVSAPAFPKNPDGRVLVHFGCGTQHDKRYINVDARPMPHVHIVTNESRLVELATHGVGPVDLIYACHVLEHLSFREVPETLAAWRARLRTGGVLRLSVPDFACIARIYGDTGQVEDILAPLMGAQDYPTNFHYTTFDEASLRKLLLAAGFSEVRRWDPRTTPDYAFDDWAGKTHRAGATEYPISLNLEAVR